MPTSNITNISQQALWRISYTLSITFLVIIVLTWLHVDNHYKPNIDQLSTTELAQENLIKKLQNTAHPSEHEFTFIPTGVFIQALAFSSSNDVSVSGYIWQKFPDSIDQPQEVKPSFIFPEQVEGSEMELQYQQMVEDGTVYGWSFNVVLRQKFNYLDYPLDHKTVWIRISPSISERNLVFTPALENYKSTEIGQSFGIEDNLVLGDWQVDETFFDYKSIHYDTNFGTSFKSQQYEYPELYFNIVLKRKFLNAFIINLVPLLTVATLLFAVLMTITAEPKKRETLGFNFTGVISIVSALFFVVLIAHIQLREQFSEDGIVYIEYFFLLMYFTMVMLIMNTYFFSRGKDVTLKWIMAEDNLLPKLCFWPFTLGVMALITLIKFVF
ncbi:hypothetical protein [Thalassotalea sp. SU-HH00458]|uniref:hypothetical protein n=1 Tax=Thalassotalea sp. SU-HH00458 TaxID=3127657 RepID=UPI00310C6D45